jgi:hypothetical protein
MATARYYLAGCRNSDAAALAFGGTTGSNTAATEEYNSTIFSPATGAWASGGNLGTAREF